MVFVEIPDGPAIGDNVPLEPPVIPQIVLQQLRAAAAGIAVHGIVSAHYRLYMAFLHGGLKGGKIGLRHILLTGVDIKVMPLGLGAGMDGKMLGAGSGFQVFPLTLQAPDIGKPQLRGEIRVFAIGLMAAPPAGIAENVDVGRPEGQPLIDVPVALLGEGIILGAAFGGGNLAQMLHFVLVKGGGHGNGLGERGGYTGASHTMEGFVPPVVFGNMQTVEGGGIIA